MEQEPPREFWLELRLTVPYAAAARPPAGIALSPRAWCALTSKLQRLLTLVSHTLKLPPHAAAAPATAAAPAASAARSVASRAEICLRSEAASVSAKELSATWLRLGLGLRLVRVRVSDGQGWLGLGSG